MFRGIRRLLDAIEAIAKALAALVESMQALADVQRDLGPATERLETLERGRHEFEAECQGLLLKAEGKLRAANNAEARERQLRKSYEHLIDPLDEEGAEPEAPAGYPIPGNNAPGSEAERLSALRLDVATDPKALVQRAKFGLR